MTDAKHSKARKRMNFARRLVPVTLLKNTKSLTDQNGSLATAVEC